MPPGGLLAGIREVQAGKKRIPPEVAAHLAQHQGKEALTAREMEILQEAAAGQPEPRPSAGRLSIIGPVVIGELDAFLGGLNRLRHS